MNIIITGQIGSGKTTVCNKLSLKLKNKGIKCGGIISLKTIEGNIEVLNLKSQEKKMLAILKDSSAYKSSNQNNLSCLETSKYFFFNEGIKFGNESILDSLNADIIFIDEIGQIELYGKGFIETLSLVQSGCAKNLIIVVRKELLEKYLKMFNFKNNALNFQIYRVDIKNRNELPDIILEKILSSIQ